jgi:hypothetical protein
MGETSENVMAAHNEKNVNMQYQEAGGDNN